MTKVKASMPLTDEEMILQYFKYIGNKDLAGILELFDYDAVIHEPFSKSQSLNGRSAIEPFLRVAMMANSGLQRNIKIEKPSNGKAENMAVALITFERGDRIRGRFTFEFTSEANIKKIKSLRIEFL
jgi:hypothetical protein